MARITVQLDSVISRLVQVSQPPFSPNPDGLQIDVTKPIQVEELICRLNIPKGILGYVVYCGRLLGMDDVVEPGSEVKLYGIFDGG